MRIGLFHGYELRGSGSNEYVRYLSRALARRGHEVHVLCRDPEPAAIGHVTRALRWDVGGEAEELLRREAGGSGSCTVHQLPHASVRPVYVLDQPRAGNVKAFANLTAAELAEYHEVAVVAVRAVLAAHPLDLLLANHVVYQPVVAAEACAPSGTPFVVVPHGSAIEYTVRRDQRYLDLARQGLRAARGIVSGNEEVRARLEGLFPELADHIRRRTRIVGVGVDTTLFQPVARDGRADAIAALRRALPSGGRTPARRAELRRALDECGVTALRDHHDDHDPRLPDADLAERLTVLDGSEPLLLYVGSLTAGKGVQSLIAAMPRVLQAQPTARLLVVGAGAHRPVLEALVHAIASQDEELLDTLVECGFDLDPGELSGPWPDVRELLDRPAERAAILEIGPELGERVLFTGRLDHELLRYLFPCADVAVFPSVVPEAYPLVLMESVANGVLPVVSDFSGFADGLRELAGWLGEEWVERLGIPAAGVGRIAAIADRVTALLADPQLQDLGPNLREIAVEHYDWDVRAQQLEEACRTFVEERP